ncbi:MAG: ABC transporter ATP-binding protein [Halanaerobiales bacterium]
MNDLLLEVKGLKTYFDNEDGLLKAVDDVSFYVNEGETLGVVGESGCGKSVTSLSVMQLVPQPRGRIAGGEINYYKDKNNPIDITKLKPHGKEMRNIRGNDMAMIFQEPMTSLNPVYTIGEQIIEGVLIHTDKSKNQARERAIEMLELVGISAPATRVDAYPHELSGGQRQRAMIAIALACDPSFLIADEPTTALDVTIEAQILKLMRDLQDEFGMSIMFITHDLGVIGEMADRVIVMYTGNIVEKAETKQLYKDPQHPYTKGLLKSVPRIGRKERLVPIEGSVPNLLTLDEDQCYFASRCPQVMDKCLEKEPPTITTEEGRDVKCWLFSEKEAAIS